MAGGGLLHGQSLPSTAPDLPFHLTARPWQPVDAPKSELLDRVEAVVRALAPLQYYNNADPNDVGNGAIRDPYYWTNIEIQYATPYFAFAAATALSEGRCADLITQAVRAMDRCTLDISDGPATDGHGEFFTAPMVKALRLFTALKSQYPDQITDAKIALWRTRMTTVRNTFMAMSVIQNWRTYASKGEWLRHQEGLISDGPAWIEGNWLTTGGGHQRERFLRDSLTYNLSPSFSLYHDETSLPETFAYNGGAAGNILDMLENGYSGASGAEMRQTIERNFKSSLLLMGASGEAPAGGRTGDHTWNDIVYANGYEMMAEIAHRNGDDRRAGQFRRAAQLAFKSAWRFQQEKGSFGVTKNLFHPSLRVRYAAYSGLTNYNGYVQIHTAEAFFTRQSTIPEQPTPSEIGGYAITLDPEYANSFANAGGMQVQICTTGETDNYSNVQWHALGIVRFSRTGWDSRLGPGNGAVWSDFARGAVFSPMFNEGGTWKNVCQLPDRYAGTFTPTFVHPLLVRGTYVLAPKSGQTGPTFTLSLTITPDGVLIDTARTAGTEAFGTLWPLLEYDGRNTLVRSNENRIATTAYPPANGTATVLQAENATLAGGATHESYYGGNGTGYVNLATSGGSVEWANVDGGPGGATSIGFRYALGLGNGSSATRTVSLTVNGVSRNITFQSTGTWDDYHQIYVPVTLAAGTANTIRIASTGQDSANLDELRVHLPAASPVEMDQQAFIALKSSHQLDASLPTIRGGYGDLRPVQVTDTAGAPIETFVYPRSAGDPTASAVRDSFVRDGANFSSVLGRVNGTLYVGRTSAGGFGDSIDLNNDGTADVIFSAPCNFFLQLANGTVTAIEADAPVTATLPGRTVNLRASVPITLNSPNYAAFQAEWFTAAEQLDPAVSGMTSDPNRDGTPNLLAYAFGIDPLETSTTANGGLPVIDSTSGYLEITYTRLKNVSNLTYAVETSSDLVTWLTGPTQTTQVGVTSLDEQRERVSVRDLTPLTGSTRRFLRVRVTAY